MSNYPAGYFEKVLAVDVESSGMAFGQESDDPTIIPKTGETFQIVSIGLVVADVKTFTPIEKLYLEIKWDGESGWQRDAEKVHGLSKEYLAEHGVDREEAVIEIAHLILKYWGNDTAICLLGHNVATFDLWFLRRLMRSEGVFLRFGNRHIDSSSCGIATFGSFTSDELFAQVGFPERDPTKHNALDDALMSLASVRLIKGLWKELVVPEIS